LSSVAKVVMISDFLYLLVFLYKTIFIQNIPSTFSTCCP